MTRLRFPGGQGICTYSVSVCPHSLSVTLAFDFRLVARRPSLCWGRYLTQSLPVPWNKKWNSVNLSHVPFFCWQKLQGKHHSTGLFCKCNSHHGPAPRDGGTLGWHACCLMLNRNGVYIGQDIFDQNESVIDKGCWKSNILTYLILSGICVIYRSAWDVISKCPSNRKYTY